MVKNVYTTLSSENFDVSDIKFNRDGLVPVIAQCVPVSYTHLTLPTKA